MLGDAHRSVGIGSGFIGCCLALTCARTGPPESSPLPDPIVVRTAGDPSGEPPAIATGEPNDANLPATAGMGSFDAGLTVADTATEDDAGANSARADVVVLVSIDGLAPRFIDSETGQGRLPAFSRLQSEGLFTHDARCDRWSSFTMPNHASILTGLPVASEAGAAAHGFDINFDPGPGITLHSHGGRAGYTPSVFDVVHDRGGHTAFFAGKLKFELFMRSYNADHGAQDVTGADDGRNKIDQALVLTDSRTLLDRFFEVLSQSIQQPTPSLLVLHLHDPDTAGHANGWGSDPYLTAVRFADSALGRIVDHLAGASSDTRSVLLVTSDHGGVDNHHVDPSEPDTYRVPFYAWSPVDPAAGTKGTIGLTPAFDWSTGSLADSPVENAEAANLSLWLLGLPPMATTAEQRLLVP